MHWLAASACLLTCPNRWRLVESRCRSCACCRTLQFSKPQVESSQLLKPTHHGSPTATVSSRLSGSKRVIREPCGLALVADYSSFASKARQAMRKSRCAAGVAAAALSACYLAMAFASCLERCRFRGMFRRTGSFGWCPCNPAAVIRKCSLVPPQLLR